MCRWIITNDIIDKGKSNGLILTDGRGEKQRMEHRFRMLDGDGEVYFEGLIDDDSNFAPLDVWGINYGCTSMQFWNYDTQQWDEL
ncbi:hypothetical protein CMI47_21545 [Candidatus Pacearchaeota archaeon]|nr:hypothetical protein [Candidatus Pacearchaeota archaeon]